MNFKGHLIGSIITGLIASSVAYYQCDVKLDDTAIILPICILGGNFPDVDTNSIPSKFYAIFGLILAIVLIYSGLPALAGAIFVPFILAKATVHRGWTHKYYLPVGMMIIANYWPEYALILIAFGVGVITHLILDKIYPLAEKGWV